MNRRLPILATFAFSLLASPGIAQTQKVAETPEPSVNPQEKQLGSSGLPTGSKSDIQQIGVFVEWVLLETRTASKLIRASASRNSAAQMREQVERLLDEEKAELLSTNYVRTRSGQRAATKSAVEIIYPTEFGFPGANEGGPDEVAAALPMHFDMRTAGFSLEIDPALGADAGTIDLSISPQWTTFEGKDYLRAEENLDGNDANVWQPRFFSVSSSASVVLRSGEPVLLHSTKYKTEDKTVLVFLQADVLTVEK